MEETLQVGIQGYGLEGAGDEEKGMVGILPVWIHGRGLAAHLAFLESAF